MLIRLFLRCFPILFSVGMVVFIVRFLIWPAYGHGSVVLYAVMSGLLIAMNCTSLLTHQLYEQMYGLHREPDGILLWQVRGIFVVSVPLFIWWLYTSTLHPIIL